MMQGLAAKFKGKKKEEKEEEEKGKEAEGKGLLSEGGPPICGMDTHGMCHRCPK